MAKKKKPIPPCPLCGRVHVSATVAVEVAAREGYLHRVAVMLDMFVNVLCGGCPDETISSRSARAAARGNWLGKAIIWFCDLFEAHHGFYAERADLGRALEVQRRERKALKTRDW